MAAILVVIVLGTLGCGGEEAPVLRSTPTLGEAATPLAISSTAFQNGGGIPVRYTCDGEDISPPLQWSHAPEGTQSFALVADDPDAPGGTWAHWVLYNLSSGTLALAEAIPPDDVLPDGSMQGRNSWGRLGYSGPRPPSGAHHYYFRLYALDTVLDLGSGATAEQLQRAMEGHILAESGLMGLYSRG